MSFSIQLEQKKKLEQSNLIAFKEIMAIIDAFQIASGQSFAINKTKAILEFLKEGNIMVIEDFISAGERRTVSSVVELADTFRSIDKKVDLVRDSEFRLFF